MMSVLF